MIAATVAAPLCAPGAGLTDGQVFRMLAEPDAAAALPMSRMARALPALAQVPADAEAFLTISLRRCEGLSATLENWAAGAGTEADKLARAVKDIDSAALCLHKGHADMLAGLQPLWRCLKAGDGRQWGDRWAASAHADAAPTIREYTRNNAGAKAKSEALKSLPALKLPPVSLLLVFGPGTEDSMQTIDEALMRRMVAPGSPQCNVQGFHGVRMPGSVWAEAISAGPGDVVAAAFKKELARRQFLFLIKTQGRVMQIVICEEPVGAELPAAPEKSILGSGALEPWHAPLAAGAYAAGYASPAMINSFNSLSVVSATAQTEALRRLFTALGEQDEDNRATYGIAARGANGLLRFAKGFMPADNTVPASFIVWQGESGLDMRLDMDAAGAEYQPGALRLVKLTRAKGSVLYYESTPCKTPAAEGWPEQVKSVGDVAAGVRQSLGDETGPSPADIRRSASALSAGLRAVGDGMGGGSAFILDVGGKEAPVLRAAYYSRIANRAKLAEGWGAIAAQAKKWVGGALPVKTGKTKLLPEATCYSLDFPGLSRDSGAHAALDGKAIAIGSSSTLAMKLLRFDDGNIPFKGAVLSFRPATLLGWLSEASGDGEDEAALAAAAGSISLAPAHLMGGVKCFYIVSSIDKGIRTVKIRIATEDDAAAN